MRIVVLGARGMLGGELVRTLTDRGHTVRAVDRQEADITDVSACAAAVSGTDAVVNAAAWTQVDAAESHEADAFLVNAIGAATVARAAAREGSRLVHISTDYVFDGQATLPYPEDAPLRPASAYGRSKAAGEWAVRAESERAMVVRTAWLYGPGGPNFAATMARLAGERETLSVVDDQRGTPTPTREVARIVAELLERDAAPGRYHATVEGDTTWCGFARAVFEELGHDPNRVRPISTEEYPLPAPRPAYSVLGHRCTTEAGVHDLPDWRTALAETLTATLAGAGRS